MIKFLSDNILINILIDNSSENKILWKSQSRVVFIVLKSITALFKLRSYNNKKFLLPYFHSVLNKQSSDKSPFGQSSSTS